MLEVLCLILTFWKFGLDCIWRWRLDIVIPKFFVYDDEDICLVMKNSDHLVYRINNDIKIIQLVK